MKQKITKRLEERKCTCLWFDLVGVELFFINFIKEQWIFVLKTFKDNIQKISFYPICTLKNAAPLSRTITDFEILQSKTALEEGSFVLFHPRIILGKKRKK